MGFSFLWSAKLSFHTYKKGRITTYSAGCFPQSGSGMIWLPWVESGSLSSMMSCFLFLTSMNISGFAVICTGRPGPGCTPTSAVIVLKIHRGQRGTSLNYITCYVSYRWTLTQAMISLFGECYGSPSNQYWLLLQDVHIEEFEKHTVSSFKVKLFLTIRPSSSELQSESNSYWSESHHMGYIVSLLLMSISHGKDAH